MSSSPFARSAPSRRCRGTIWRRSIRRCWRFQKISAWLLYREAALQIGVWPTISDPDDTPTGRNWDDGGPSRKEPRGPRSDLSRATPHVGILYGVKIDAELAPACTAGRAARANPAADDPNSHGDRRPPAAPPLRRLRAAGRDRRTNRRWSAMRTVVAADIETMRAPSITYCRCRSSSASWSRWPSRRSRVIRSGAVLAEARSPVRRGSSPGSHRLRGPGRRWSPAVHVEVERTFFADVIQRMYTDDGNGDGRLARNFFEQVSLLTVRPCRRRSRANIRNAATPRGERSSPVARRWRRNTTS